jgi:hypothetical protein
MHGFEADGGDLLGVLEAAGGRVGELSKALANSRGMVGDLRLQFRSRHANLDEARAFRRADPFDTAARKLLLIGHVKQYLELVEPRLATSFHGGGSHW